MFEQLIGVVRLGLIPGFRKRLLALVFIDEADDRLAYGDKIERASSELQAMLLGLEIIFGLVENRFEATME